MPLTAHGLDYPVLGDANNPPADIQAALESVDARYGFTVANWAALAAITSPFPGLVVWVTSLFGKATYNGTKWLAPRQFKHKVTTETITANATLQNDDELVLSIPEPGTYKALLDLIVFCSSGITGDIRVGFAFPTGVCHFKGLGADVGLGTSTGVGTGNWQQFRNASSGSSSLAYGTSSSLQLGLTIEVLLIATAAGNLQLMWCQDVSNANSAQVMGGSHMTLDNVA